MVFGNDLEKRGRERESRHPIAAMESPPQKVRLLDSETIMLCMLEKRERESMKSKEQVLNHQKSIRRGLQKEQLLFPGIIFNTQHPNGNTNHD